MIFWELIYSWEHENFISTYFFQKKIAPLTYTSTFVKNNNKKMCKYEMCICIIRKQRKCAYMHISYIHIFFWQKCLYMHVSRCINFLFEKKEKKVAEKKVLGFHEYMSSLKIKYNPNQLIYKLMDLKRTWNKRKWKNK